MGHKQEGLYYGVLVLYIYYQLEKIWLLYAKLNEQLAYFQCNIMCMHICNHFIKSNLGKCSFFPKKIGMERMVYLCFESKYSNKICQGLRVLLIRLLCGYNGVLWASLGQFIKIMFTVTMSMEIRYQHQLSTAISAADAYQLNIYNSINWKWEVHFLIMLQSSLWNLIHKKWTK